MRSISLIFITVSLCAVVSAGPLPGTKAADPKTAELLARVPDYEVDESRTVKLRSEMFRGFQCLPITFKPF